MAEHDDDASPKDTIKFHYLKSNFFRVIHADGAWGGVTPRGTIHMDFYSERSPIPQEMVFRLAGNPGDAERALGEEIKEKRVSKADYIRELEVGVTLDLPAAKALMGWLEQRIKIAENRNEEIKKHGEEG
jgi:hypothetical protein